MMGHRGMDEPCVEMIGVSKRFGQTLAVDGLDLRVPAGSLCGFLGPNGSGKTTTLRMILRILTPTAGIVRVLGRDGGNSADPRTGYLPEERGLYRRMRVRAHLRYLAQLKGLRHPDAAIERWLSHFGLGDRAQARIEELSKGLAQRVQFIAAVVHEPQLLILDEPFSGLDPVSMDALRETVYELRRKGTTIVLSTHDMAMAERLCDSVIMLHRGRKVLDGPLGQIQASRSGTLIRVRFSSDSQVLPRMEGVACVRNEGREQTLELAPGADPRRVLQGLVERGDLQRFEIAQPTLHEIFVQIAGVGGDHLG
jgi:ABC-2 type transport system ATP-binding protein